MAMIFFSKCWTDNPSNTTIRINDHYCADLCAMLKNECASDPEAIKQIEFQQNTGKSQEETDVHEDESQPSFNYDKPPQYDTVFTRIQ